MAVLKMSKLRLLALNSDKNRLLDSLSRTACTQIKTVSADYGGLSAGKENPDNAVRKEIDDLRLAISAVEAAVYEKGDKAIAVTPDGFDVSESEYSAVFSRREEILSKAKAIITIRDEISALKSKVAECDGEQNGYKPYVGVKEKFSSFISRGRIKIYFGLVPSSLSQTALNALSGLDNAYAELFTGDGQTAPIAAVIYGDTEKAEAALSENGFTACRYTGDYTAETKIKEIANEKSEISRQIKDFENRIIKSVNDARDFKILCDRLTFETEKASSESKFLNTDSAFILEAFVPAGKEEKVRRAIERTTENAEIEFTAATDDDLPPTYTVNKPLAKNFEFVTNMYSYPHYGALDPNAVMGFFFSLFMGIVVADAGYGIFMAIACALYSKKARGGMKSLANILSLSGLFAIPFGCLFDSFFGYPLVHTVISAKFGAGNAYAEFYTAHIDPIKSFSSVAGISIPTMLLWSLAFGALHMAVGYFLKGVHEFSNRNYLSGIGEGLSWTFFMLGLVGFAFSMIESVDAAVAVPVKNVSLTVIAVSLLISVTVAAINGKGFGKVTGAFVSVYGIINIISDILSYARIYGLMLSGSQIATIFTNSIAIDLLFPKGVGGVIGGVLVIVFGNAFNLAMGVLGAYIHVSRLQYVEFFGKFFEGEGEPFRPLGCETEHINVIREEAV